jgi:hypothetical protein
MRVEEPFGVVGDIALSHSDSPLLVNRSSKNTYTIHIGNALIGIKVAVTDMEGRAAIGAWAPGRTIADRQE